MTPSQLEQRFRAHRRLRASPSSNSIVLWDNTIFGSSRGLRAHFRSLRGFVNSNVLCDSTMFLKARSPVSSGSEPSVTGATNECFCIDMPCLGPPWRGKLSKAVLAEQCHTCIFAALEINLQFCDVLLGFGLLSIATPTPPNPLLGGGHRVGWGGWG